MLLGNYRLSLDNKGRLSIPAALRAGLRDQFAPDDTTLILTKYFENCLVIYPKPVWLTIQTQLLSLSNDPPSRGFLRQFCASANVCNLDRQNRILVPAALRQYAGIDGEAMIIGLVRKLEVWSPDRWEETYGENGSTQFDTSAFLMNLQL